MNVLKAARNLSVTRFCICLLLMAASYALITACTNKNKTPSGVLSREEYQSVMWDMIQADRFAAQFLLKDSASKDVKAETFKLYERIFQLHDITREEFVKSYKYYLKRPDITKVIFDSMAARSTRERDDLYKMKDSLAKKQDSINVEKAKVKQKKDTLIAPKLRLVRQKDSLAARKARLLKRRDTLPRK